VPFQIKQLRPPMISPLPRFSKGEADNTDFLNALLWAVKFDVEAWAAALELFRLAKLRRGDPDLTRTERDLARKWQWIAARECVMQLYYLKERLVIIREKLGLCPTVAQHVDGQALRTAANLLDSQFPAIDKLRHAVAHSSGVDSRPHMHAPDGKYGFSRFRKGDRLEIAYQGTVSHLDINDETLSKLVSIATRFLGAFVPSAKALAR
jgi:hypothetical protein